MKTFERPTTVTGLGTQQWTDLYFRHFFGDTGAYPTNGTQSASPDVIPAGDKPYSDPTQLIDDNNWNKDFGNSTNAQQANYIYLRGANLNTTESRSGKCYLYYSPASLLLWPTDPVDPTKGWAKNPLSTSSGAKYVDVSAGPNTRFVVSEPFQWIPQQLSNDHYCLIGRVETPQNPNPIPTLGTLTDFAKYISEHPNMAWRNVVTVSASSPTFTTSVDYSQGQEGGYVYMNLRCYNAPNGSLISMNSGTPGPEPPIYHAATEIKNPDPPQDQIFTITVYTKIPADWRSNITYTWASNGRTALPDMTFVLDPIMPIADDHPLAKYARPLQELGIDVRAMPKGGPSKGIVLGSQVTKTPPTAGPSFDVRRALSEVDTKSSIYVVGVSWLERASSVLGSDVAGRDVTIVRGVDKGVETETVKLDTVIPDGDTPPADLVLDTEFSNGDTGGQTQVAVVTTNVPIGAEVWFKNLDGSVPISVKPSKVSTEPTYAVATFVELEPNYQAKIRSFLRLNGTVLPASWSMKLEAVALSGTDVPQLTMPKPVTEVNGGPKPGTLLGRVTVTD